MNSRRPNLLYCTLRNMTPSEQHILLLSTLLQLEKRTRHAESVPELSFIMVNETLRLTKYRQALLWTSGPGGKITVDSVSGVDMPDANAPFIMYMRGLLKHLLRRTDNGDVHLLQEKDLDEKYRSGWQEWDMGTALWCPLVFPRGKLPGGLLFSRQKEWDNGEIALLQGLTDAYAHAWYALKGNRFFPKNPAMLIYEGWRKRGMQLLGLILIVLLMGLPVRLSAPAPAEVVPSEFLIVSAPMDGVIQRFYVEPGQEIKTGQLLFRLDDTGIRNEYEVSKKALAVSQAEYKSAAQKAFMNEKSRADMRLLKARIQQKSAEADYMAAVLRRTQIHAAQDGIAVFGDVSDWLGKPVITGEKVLILADPGQVEVEIRLPVTDAINLETGADILVFLNIEPDMPLPAKLRQASYEAQVTPDGILAFRVKASFTQKEKKPRIGLRGTARIYGKKVTLFYYIMRRPLSALRQRLGF